MNRDLFHRFCKGGGWLLSVLLSAVLAVGCAVDEIPDSVIKMSFSTPSLRLPRFATDTSFVIETDEVWTVDTLMAANAQSRGSWISVTPLTGQGKAQVDIHVDANTDNRARTMYLQVTMSVPYPSVISNVVMQDGLVQVTTDPEPQHMTGSSVTLGGTWSYTGGGNVLETGIAYKAKESMEDFVLVPASDTAFQFSVDITGIERNTPYSYKAYVRDSHGEIFYGEECVFRAALTFNTGSITGGLLKSNIEAENIFIELPYVLGDGTTTYTVSAISSIAGLTVESQDVVLAERGGTIRLVVSGTPETYGPVTFTFTGLPEDPDDPSKQFTVVGEVIEGGEDVLIYWEAFGPAPEGTNDNGNITDLTKVNFTRYGQPNAQYAKSGGANIRNEVSTGGTFAGKYEGASGPCVLFIGGGGSNGMFTISGLNTQIAGNVRMTFASHRTGNTSYVMDEVTLSYSTDGGETFVPLTYSRENLSGNKWLVNTVNEPLPSAESLTIQFKFTSTTAAYRIDDVKLFGDIF